MRFILSHGPFFYPIISFLVCGFIALYQSRRWPSRRYMAFVMNICALTMCAYSAYAVPMEPSWWLMVFLLISMFQSALISATPVRLFKTKSANEPIQQE